MNPQNEIKLEMLCDIIKVFLVGVKHEFPLIRDVCSNPWCTWGNIFKVRKIMINHFSLIDNEKFAELSLALKTLFDIIERTNEDSTHNQSG